MNGLAYASATRPYPRMTRDRSESTVAEHVAVGLVLRKARKDLELSQETAAEKAGISQQVLSSIEGGRRKGVDLAQVTALAEAYGLTRDEVLVRAADLSRTGGSVTPLRPSASFAPRQPEGLLPIRDRVQAGAWLQADDFGQDVPRTYPAVRDPRFPHADQWLSEVLGDSLNALAIFDKDLVHCVSVADIGYYPKTGDIVEVERTRFDGQERELTVKQVEVTPTGILLWPRSTNPRWQDPLEVRSGVAAAEDIEVRIRGLVLAAIRRF